MNRLEIIATLQIYFTELQRKIDAGKKDELTLQVAQVRMLGEIAAQLADLNERLEPGADRRKFAENLIRNLEMVKNKKL